jgi:hypothetical protein
MRECRDKAYGSFEAFKRKNGGDPVSVKEARELFYADLKKTRRLDVPRRAPQT